ncbi:MAG: serine/threonine-protein kinase [Gemmatimonadaceae bacterium]|nr:serine/threonine-protein kinase [Gemmatimonadaceae bacterium]
MTPPDAELIALQTALAGEYFVQRELGRGGMGIVYLARDIALERDVAIKVLPTTHAADPDARQRFLREARLAAGLSHPHIVPIHRVGEADGFVFFVMTYIEGETLGERLRTRGPLSADETTRLMREVAWALAYAHGRGIVHKDIKPDNILLDAATGRAIVTDFGIAQAGGESGIAGVAGTAHFMSPEQAAGVPIDGRSDIYALGVVGYLAASGRLPAETLGTRLRALPADASRPALSVAAAAPGLSPALIATIDRCLLPEPARRFADGEAVAAALAPASQARPALPPALRAWLEARNPMLAPYLAWFGLFGTLTTANLISWVTGNRPEGPADIVLLAGITSMPLVPIVGFHVNQAYRQFRAGYTLADLREALAVARRERDATEALTRAEHEPRGHRPLRLATVAAGTWLATTFALVLSGVTHERQLGVMFVLVPLLTTLVLMAASNALDVQFIPDGVRRAWQAGLRERLWNSRVGQWLAKKLGAPERSRAVGGAVFRPTEAAIGLAASELYAQLPTAYQAQLHELPAVVTALEAQAAHARAELDVVAALAASANDEGALASRRAAAQRQLSSSVSALEQLRLGLLKMHAGTTDLAPMTTLIESARRVSDDVDRLLEARREVEGLRDEPAGWERVATPT